MLPVIIRPHELKLHLLMVLQEEISECCCKQLSIVSTSNRVFAEVEEESKGN